MKPIVRLSSLIEMNKKFTSLSAIFDIYFIWKDDNLIANASSSNAVFFFNWFFSIETKKDHVKLDTSSGLKGFHRHLFRSPIFRFLFLATKLRKYYVIFVYILQGKMGKMEKPRKENHATKVIKIPKTKRWKYGMNKTIISVLTSSFVFDKS